MPLLYLNQKDVTRTAPAAADLLQKTEEVFRAKKKLGLKMPPKFTLALENGAYFRGMPGHFSPRRAAGIKWVGYFPGNPLQGLPAVNGLILLNDPETGLPTAIMDAGWITAYRTASVSALSCRLLATERPRTLGLVGYGVQAESHLSLLAKLFPLEQVEVWGPNGARCRRFADRMGERLSLAVKAVPSAHEAVREKALVVSVTPIGVEPATRLRYAWLAPGAVVCPVEYDCAWEAELFRKADGLFTDDLPQMEHYRRTQGYFRGAPRARAELADLFDAPPRRSEREILVAINLGVGLLDIALAREIERRAREAGIGTLLPR